MFSNVGDVAAKIDDSSKESPDFVAEQRDAAAAILQDTGKKAIAETAAAEQTGKDVQTDASDLLKDAKEDVLSASGETAAADQSGQSVFFGEEGCSTFAVPNCLRTFGISCVVVKGHVIPL